MKRAGFLFVSIALLLALACEGTRNDVSNSLDQTQREIMHTNRTPPPPSDGGGSTLPPDSGLQFHDSGELSL